jgi:Skp family chaperone for outer membrane proteins
MKTGIFAVLSTLAAAAAVGDVKVATVDMLLLVRNHPGYESNKTLLKATESDYQKKLDKIKSDVESIQEEGKKLSEQARNPMLSAAAKQKLEKDLVDIQNRFLAGQQRLRAEAMRSQQDLQDLEARLLKTATAEIRKHVDAFAAANGYDFVFDSAAAVFAKKSFDVTDGIMRKMGVDPAKARSRDESK